MIAKSSAYLIALAIILIFVYRYIHKNNHASFPVVNHDTIIVGTNAEYPPFSFRENNTCMGLDIDIVHEIARRLNKKVIVEDMPFEALIPRVQLGSIHLIAAGMTPTPEREKQVFFTPIYLANDNLIIVSRNENPFNTVNQLYNTQVIVNEGFTADSYASSINLPYIVRLASVTEALLALQTGRANAFITAQSAIQPFFALHKKNILHTAVIPDTKENYALIVSKKYPDLYAQITQIMDNMEKDGTIAHIKKRWFL